MPTGTSIVPLILQAPEKMNSLCMKLLEFIQISVLANAGDKLMHTQWILNIY